MKYFEKNLIFLERETRTRGKNKQTNKQTKKLLVFLSPDAFLKSESEVFNLSRTTVGVVVGVFNISKNWDHSMRTNVRIQIKNEKKRSWKKKRTGKTFRKKLKRNIPVLGPLGELGGLLLAEIVFELMGLDIDVARFVFVGS